MARTRLMRREAPPRPKANREPCPVFVETIRISMVSRLPRRMKTKDYKLQVPLPKLVLEVKPCRASHLSTSLKLDHARPFPRSPPRAVRAADKLLRSLPNCLSLTGSKSALPPAAACNPAQMTLHLSPPKPAIALPALRRENPKRHNSRHTTRETKALRRIAKEHSHHRRPLARSKKSKRMHTFHLGRGLATLASPICCSSRPQLRTTMHLRHITSFTATQIHSTTLLDPRVTHRDPLHLAPTALLLSLPRP